MFIKMRMKSLIIFCIICVISVIPFSIAESSILHVNNPSLVEGMTPVKWDGFNWQGTNEFDIEWYDYNNLNSPKWANVKLADGSMYVWIPRFTYKISAGQVYIKWSIGIEDDISDDYLRSPAFFYGEYLGGHLNDNISFMFRNGTDNELPGIWVAKFMASEDGNIKVTENSTVYVDDFKTLFDRAKQVAINSGITNEKTISHMMKNSEWAAVAYLTNSYGKIPYINNYADGSTRNTGYSGATQDAQKSSSPLYTYEWNSEKGIKASTTHNVYGIYDMSGAEWEYVAGYIDNAIVGDDIINSNDFNDVDRVRLVKLDTDNNNYDRIESNYDGLALADTADWDQDASDTPYGQKSVFIRGGNAELKENSGIFAFSRADKSSKYGFRPTILILPDSQESNLSLIESEAIVLEGETTIVNIYFSTAENLSFGVSDIAGLFVSDGDKKSIDLMVQYHNDEETINIYSANQEIKSLEKITDSQVENISLSSLATEPLYPGNYVMKVELGGDIGEDIDKKSVFYYDEDKECSIILNELNLKDEDGNDVKMAGIDLNKVRVTTYGSTGTRFQIDGITIDPEPIKQFYAKEEKLDLTGGKIKAFNDAGIEMIIALKEDYIVKGLDSSTTGPKNIEVEYGGERATFEVMVSESFYNLNISSDPPDAGTVSFVGDTMQGEVITIRAIPNQGYKFLKWTGPDGLSFTNQNSTITNFAMPAANTNIVGKFTDIIGIEVSPAPTKTEYGRGEPLKLDGGEIIIHYGNGSTETKSLTSSDVTTSLHQGEILSEGLNQKVTVNYEGKSAEFYINVYPWHHLTLEKNIQEGGVVLGEGSKEYKSIVEIKVTLNANYIFQNWTCKETNTGIDIPLNEIGFTDLGVVNGAYTAKITMPAKDITITANLIAPLTVTYTAGTGGGIKLGDSGTVKAEIKQVIPSGGSTSPVVAVANSGYRFSKWNDKAEYENQTRNEENVVADATYTAQFQEILWNVVYRNCQGELISQEQVRDEGIALSVPSGCNIPSHSSTGWEFIEETAEVPDFNCVTREGFIPDGTIQDYVVYAVCIERIIFTPNENSSDMTSIFSTITATGVQEGTLEYIITEDTGNPINGVSDYTDDGVFELVYPDTLGWYKTNTELGGYTGDIYRSTSGAYQDSNSQIIIHSTRIMEKLSFEYIISDAQTCKFGVTVNGDKVIDISGDQAGWGTYSSWVYPIDRKIKIGLTYSKGGDTPGNDLAAIKGLRIEREWTLIGNGETIDKVAFLTGDHYIHARAMTDGENPQMIEEISGAFKGIAKIGDVNLDGSLDISDYNKLSDHINGIETLSNKALIRADVNLNGIINQEDLVLLNLLIEEETVDTTYNIVAVLDGVTEQITQKNPGQNVTLTAVPGPGQTFAGWRTIGITLPATSTVTFTMPENDVMIVAEFK